MYLSSYTSTSVESTVMDSFTTEEFARRLIAESLFFDAEYSALGTLSLIDLSLSREVVIASYSPEEEVFIVEEASEWEDYKPGDDDDIGYALAIDSTELGTYDTAEEASTIIFKHAKDRNLVPSVTMLFEDEEIS